MKTVLMTRRTLLLPATASDLPTMTSLWNEIAVRELLFEGDAVGPAHARRLLDAGLAEAPSGLGWWLVCPWDNGPALGCVGLLRSRVAAQAFRQPGEAIEVMVAFGPAAWAQGYAQETTEELVSHAVHRLKLPRLNVLSGVADPMFDQLLRALGFEARLEADSGRRRVRLHELNAASVRPAGAHVKSRGEISLDSKPNVMRLSAPALRLAPTRNPAWVPQDWHEH